MYSADKFDSLDLLPNDLTNLSEMLTKYFIEIEKILINFNDINYINLCLDFQLFNYLTSNVDKLDSELLCVLLHDMSLNVLLISKILNSIQNIKNNSTLINKHLNTFRKGRKIFGVYNTILIQKKRILLYIRKYRIGKSFLIQVFTL
jgi:hypothetical protein